MSAHFDFFVIGGGSGGVRAARIAAGHGAKVGLAEGRDLGGTCVNVGCVPKKLMAYAADFSATFEDAIGYGWSVGETVFDWGRFLQSKDREILRLNTIYRSMLEKSGVHLFDSYASFVGPKTLDVGGESVTADHILIATGGKPVRPDFPGAEYVITSDEAFHLSDLPKRVVILGGGYIAVEFAHIFSGMGADVTLIYRGDLFLRGFDIDIRKTLAEEMRKQGISLIFGQTVQSVEKREGSGLSVHLQNGETLECESVLSAIGRAPNTEKLALGTAGIQTDKKGTILRDADYRTNVSGVYALGDVAGDIHLTPVAIKEGHVLADRLFGNRPDRKVNYKNIATAVFSGPPIATVGLSEEEARKAGHDVEIYRTSFGPMRYALTDRDEKVMQKLVVDRKTRALLGVHMVGIDAPEIIQGFAVALNAMATKEIFDDTMPVHPTSAEEFVTMREPV